MQDKENKLLVFYYKLKEENAMSDERKTMHKNTGQNNKNEYYESYLEKRETVITDVL